MLKLFLGFLFSFILFVLPAFANDDTFSFDLGKFKIKSLIVTQMEHDKNLFKYSDKQALNKYLEIPNSNLSAINVFFVNTGENKILFDSGTDSTVLISRLAEINIKPEDINIICVTHMHFDHIGGLIKDYKKIFTNAVIYISQEEAKANQNSELFSIYGSKIKLFKQNEEIVAGVKAVPAFGHTAGHTAYLVSSDDKNLLIWGDILHAVVQFQYSDIYMTYDTDPIQTLSLRKKILKEYSKNKYYIAGSHLIYPGIGTIEKNKKEGYTFIPLK